MKSALLVVLSAAIALAWFGPNVRIDHKNSPPWDCTEPSVTVGPGAPSSQPVYVAFEVDSGMVICDVMFQKSADAGRTWLPADVLVRRDAGSLDITTDSDGNIYILYIDSLPNHIHCVRSTDGGATWSPETRVNDYAHRYVGWARIAADTADNLLCAWNDDRTGSLHVWSSVSTDRGVTWSQSVRVCGDTMSDGCRQPDVFVQPGTNHYLVAAETPGPDGNNHPYLYRSADAGQTFQPGARLDTFRGLTYVGQPHVVADAQHIICSYTGDNAEVRTLYAQPDTWGAPHFVGNSYRGPKLATSADVRVHTALMARNNKGPYHTYYAFSSDHGVSWSEPELVNDDTTAAAYDPDIGADSAGHVYIVWRDLRYGQLWFATNNPAAVAEAPPQQPIGVPPLATVIRNVLVLGAVGSRQNTAYRAELLDAAGRKVADLQPGANDVSKLAPGVYFIREGRGIRGEGSGKTRKVVVTR
jgi:hypothetical protein